MAGSYVVKMKHTRTYLLPRLFTMTTYDVIASTAFLLVFTFNCVLKLSYILLQDSPLSVVDTTRVKLSTLEGDDSLPATRSPLPPSPPPSQDMSPMRLSATPAGLQSGERSSDDRVSTSAGVSPMGVRFSRVPDSVDTTISELNVRRLPRRDEEDGSVKGSVIGEESSSDTTSRDNVGVVLKR